MTRILWAIGLVAPFGILVTPTAYQGESAPESSPAGCLICEEWHDGTMWVHRDFQFFVNDMIGTLHSVIEGRCTDWHLAYGGTIE